MTTPTCEAGNGACSVTATMVFAAELACDCFPAVQLRAYLCDDHEGMYRPGGIGCRACQAPVNVSEPVRLRSTESK